MRRVSESVVHPPAVTTPEAATADVPALAKQRQISFANSLPLADDAAYRYQANKTTSPRSRSASAISPHPKRQQTVPEEDAAENAAGTATYQHLSSPPQHKHTGFILEKPPLAPLHTNNAVSEARAARCHNDLDESAPYLETGYNRKGTQANADVDLAHGAILIHPKKIDNFRRFRILFVGLLLFISSSTQGMHSLFGTLYLQTVYRFNVRQMAIVYLCGQAFGMFVFPFGMLYDWFGPRVVVAAGSVIAALGHLLFALMFAGHIDVTVANCAVFYAIMCWGCYALDVVVLPAVLSHMPRDRGQPTGLLETFSGLGSSFFSCLFRGFFGNNFENLMWFMFAVTLAAGVVGTWYLEDAPYVVNRWQQRHITPREQLRKYLIRNRYMSQLVPRRRYILLSVILILLNFYLTIQAVVVAYLAAEMTDGKKRGIAIGSIVIVLLLLILLIPLDALDGPTEQDKQVIETAKEKEEEVRALHRKHHREMQHRSSKENDTKQEQRSVATEAHGAQQPPPTVNNDVAAEVRVGASDQHDGENAAAHEVLSISDASASSTDTVQVYAEEKVPMPRASVVIPAPPPKPQPRGGLLTQRMGLPLYKPVSCETSLISVDLDDVEEVEVAHKEKIPSPPLSSLRRRTTEKPPLALSLSASKRGPAVAASDPASSSTPGAKAEGSSRLHLDGSYTVYIDERGNMSVEAARTVQPSPSGADIVAEEVHPPHCSYEHPHVQVITLCGEVYVAPVYQTTFWESLTYLDMWMIAYTTMCVWGVGLTMVGNWNIYIMLLARYGAMEQKHYILFAAMAGVSTAGGRVFLGMYERILQIIRERTGVTIVPTIIYPCVSIGLLLGLIFWIALPGDKVLVLAYLIGPTFYGMSTSITPYVLGTIFDRDLGMHYGFCFFTGAIGFVLCYWCSWYLTYENQTVLTPRGYLCVGERRCMNRAVGIYIALVFSSIFPAYILHRRYSKLVSGELKQKRVIVPHLKRMFRCCGSGSDDEVGSSEDKSERVHDGLEVADAEQPSQPNATNPLTAA